MLDVFEKALSEANLSWKNDNGNYISKINGLAEFDNGSLSGWMYLLNGTRVGFGIAEQTLKNGDIIIFHYTDDYTQEQDSEKLTSSSSGGSSVPSYDDYYDNYYDDLYGDSFANDYSDLLQGLY